MSASVLGNPDNLVFFDMKRCLSALVGWPERLKSTSKHWADAGQGYIQHPEKSRAHHSSVSDDSDLLMLISLNQNLDVLSIGC